ncbi:MAG: CsbD family protein [Actinobacteria bacterium]|nr:CsbD family protein [Actinomycetota bacterium]
MGIEDKISNKVEQLKGKGKEATGRATDDKRLEDEGKADQGKANIKQAGEKIKEAAKNIFKN